MKYIRYLFLLGFLPMLSCGRQEEPVLPDSEQQIPVHQVTDWEGEIEEEYEI
ncbi:MAG: hypothetical protein J1E16_04215 [Muribaculaceae bacterium]|nr:hypothetical protein [Muribaculaceae bacterium]